MIRNLIKSAAKSIVNKLFHLYSLAGYPLLPITRFMREPMRWYYHQEPVLRHDSKFKYKPFLLHLLHRLLIVDHPHDFTIYQNQIKFRSFGSLMSVQGYYVGEIEYHLVQYIVSQIRPGFVMIDVGAHHGLYTLIVAYELKSRGWEGVIHSFEPDPSNFTLLKYNICQNKLDKYVVLHQEAVANTEGEENLLIFAHENSANTLECNSHLYGNKDNKSVVTQPVKTVNLNSLLNKISGVNLIKMDIQGSEYLALEGAEKLITRNEPIIVVEAVQEWETASKIKEFLVDHNYEIYSVDKNGILCQQKSSDVFVSWDWIGLPI